VRFGCTSLRETADILATVTANEHCTCTRTSVLSLKRSAPISRLTDVPRGDQTARETDDDVRRTVQVCRSIEFDMQLN